MRRSLTLSGSPQSLTHVVLSLKHRIANEVKVGLHFRKLKFGSLTLKVGKSDSCFRTVSGDIIVLKNIVRQQRRVYLIGRKFLPLEDYYKYPIPSSDLGIFRVSALGRERLAFQLSDVKNKCYLMPDGHHYVCVPVLHTSQSM